LPVFYALLFPTIRSFPFPTLPRCRSLHLFCCPPVPYVTRLIVVLAPSLPPFRDFSPSPLLVCRERSFPCFSFFLVSLECSPKRYVSQASEYDSSRPSFRYPAFFPSVFHSCLFFSPRQSSPAIPPPPIGSLNPDGSIHVRSRSYSMLFLLPSSSANARQFSPLMIVIRTSRARLVFR